MALTVLIVEDEQSASRLLSGIAAEVGLSARATGSAKEAQELCAHAASSGQPFSAVVLDLVLSELDGFQFGAAARAASWGAKLPIIVISGIYKKLPEDFATRIQPAAFFAKPFEPAALRAALKQQTVDVCVAAVGTLSGRFQFEQKPAEAVNGVPDMRTSPVALVLEAAKRLGNPAAAKPWLEQRAQEKLNRSPELEREIFALKTFWPGEAVTPLATGGRSVGDVLTRVKSPELPLLQYLCMSGLLTLSSATAKPGVKSQPAPSADDDKGKKFTAQEEAARAALFADRDRLRDGSHYEVLGVAPGASAEEIKAGWFVAAKRYHSDAFSGLDLGSARRVAEELFARVNEANTALSNANRRAEYDVYLDRKAKGLPTDVGAILRAEGLFQRGEVLFKSGRWEDAETQFREAISLNDTEAEFHAFLGMAMFKRSGKPEEALPHVQKSLKMEPRLQSGAIFLSQLYAAQDEVERPKSLLRKAFDKDTDLIEVKDDGRRMRD